MHHREVASYFLSLQTNSFDGAQTRHNPDSRSEDARRDGNLRSFEGAQKRRSPYSYRDNAQGRKHDLSNNCGYKATTMILEARYHEWAHTAIHPNDVNVA